MSVRSGVLAFAVTAALGLAGLLLSGATEGPATAFSLDVPAGTLTPYLYPGQLACQGPIDPPAAYAGIRAWIWPGYPPRAVLRLTVRDFSSGATLAAGRLVHTNTSVQQNYPSPLPATASLQRTLPAGKRITICFRNIGSTVVNLLGGNPTNNNAGLLTIHGHLSAVSVSLLFLRTHSDSLLSQVPALFRRAALFRPRWVESWTFWVLALALLATFPALGLAVAKASSSRPAGDADARAETRTQ